MLTRRRDTAEEPPGIPTRRRDATEEPPACAPPLGRTPQEPWSMVTEGTVPRLIARAA